MLFTSGKVDFIQVVSGNRVISTGDNNRLTVGDHQGSFPISAKERTLLELLREKDADGEIMRGFLARLLGARL